MDQLQPQPIGDRQAIKELRSMIFVGIQGATVVYPKGFATQAVVRTLLGRLGNLLTIHTTDPFPSTPLYLVVTPEDMRIYSKPLMSSPFEIGRWNKGSYRASIPVGGARLALDLEVERLGRVHVFSTLRGLTSEARPVFDLILKGASGPVTTA